MLDAELAEIVANLRLLGTDIADVEVKNSRGGLPKSLRETLSSFSNTRGGVVVLGLDEARGFAPVGLPNPAKIAADLGSMCSSEMEPPLRPLIGIHQFEGDQVVVAEIPELDPAQRPCFYTGAGMTKGSFVRVSDGDRRLSAYEVQVMLSSRGQPRDDEQAVSGTTTDDLDSASVDALVARLRTSRPYAFKDLDRLAVLRRAKVLVPGQDGQTRFTSRPAGPRFVPSRRLSPIDGDLRSLPDRHGRLVRLRRAVSGQRDSRGPDTRHGS